MTSELSHPVQTITYSVPSLQYLIGFSNLACLKESSSSSSVLLLLQSSQFQINGSSLLLITQTKNFGTSLHISSHPTLSLSKFCLQVDSEFDHILTLPPLIFPTMFFFPNYFQKIWRRLGYKNLQGRWLCHWKKLSFEWVLKVSLDSDSLNIIICQEACETFSHICCILNFVVQIWDSINLKWLDSRARLTGFHPSSCSW